MEQKENGWWKEKLNELRNQIYAEDCESSDFDPYTIELRQELEAFISQVEQDARKDERERVIKEAIELIESTKLEEAPPFSASNEFREKATLINENLMPLVKAGLIKALKGLSDNNK